MTAEKTDGLTANERRRRSRADRRDEILHVATEVFATRGYNNASLAEVAGRVGLTQQGLLHYFPSKVGLLTGVLDHRDATEIDELPSGRPHGLAFLRHLVETARHNATREGIVRLYTVLSAESVTTSHPARDYFRDRYRGLRVMIVEALREARETGDITTSSDDETVASAIVAVMDGLQVQWLLTPETTDMATATETAITALIGTTLPPAPEQT
ncbi:MAG: TetR/AcrR family transcriptional regulator [Saccharothrix sp.]|nr:TetR/AcrR family transcriptional regulator [Saccharothrix sp.]